MELKGSQVEQFLNTSSPSQSIILIHGPDGGLVSDRAKQITRSFLGDDDDPMSVIRLQSDEIANEPGRLVDEATAISLFGGRRVIRVRIEGQRQINKSIQALMDTSLQDTLVVFEAGDLRKGHSLRNIFEKAATATSIACYVEDAEKRPLFVKNELQKLGKTIDDEVARFIATRLGDDRLSNRKELEKLATYVGSETQSISMEDAQSIISSIGEDDASDIIDAVFAGNVEEALNQFQGALSAGISGTQIILSAQRHINQLKSLRSVVDRGTPPQAALKGARPPVFFKRQPVFLNQLRRWTSSDLNKAGEKLQETILNCRQNPNMEESLIGNCFLSLSSQARRTK